MRTILATIDAVLNRYTMYRVVLYALGGFLAVSLVLAASGAVGISAVGLMLSIAILAASSYAANKLLALALHVPANSESWLITALILACILPPVDGVGRAGLVALTAALAMVSKYVLVYRGSHIFNPAAVAAVVMSVTGLLPATWWVATPPLLWFTILLALVVLRKTRCFALFAAFTIMAVALLTVVGLLHGQPLAAIIKNALLSWPIIFFGSVMLTEPATLPPNRYYQILYALIVGSIFASQLHAGSVGTTPQVALILGNVFVLLTTPARGMMLRLLRTTQLSPAYYDLAFAFPEGRRINFEPGQYIEWTLPHTRTDGRGNRRTFSIASSPAEKELHIGVRRYDKGSSFKRALFGLRPGQVIRAAHVAGSFTLPAEPARPLVFIAGGIGITPFRSMLQDLIDRGEKRTITLLYLANTDKDFIYSDVLLAAKKIGLTTYYLTGVTAPEQVKALLPADLAQATVFLSGPDAMVTSYRLLVQQRGANPVHIRTDHFSGY